MDNAIVVMENIDRFREQGLDRVTASKIGSNQVGPAVMAATVTTIGAFIPLAMQGGIMGAFISPLPKTLIIAIFASFFVSIAITPNLSSKFLSKFKKEDQKHNKFRDVISVIFVLVLTFVAFLNDFEVTIWTVILSIAFSGTMVLKIYFRNKKAKQESKNMKHSSYIDTYVKWLEQFL